MSSIKLEEQNKKYSYADYIMWDDDKRYELINGTVYCMSPAPGSTHQEISVILVSKFYNYLKGKKCRVFSAPFDVRFVDKSVFDNDIENVVQPDIVVYCDRAKIDKRGGIGSPDLIVEIASSSSVKRDMNDKYFLYEKFGVREYWVVFPYEMSVVVFKLGEDKKYKKQVTYCREDEICVGIFEDLKIDLKEVFKNIEEY